MTFDHSFKFYVSRYVFSQIPNFLTILRIAACPVLIILLRDRIYVWAMIVVLVAGITDGLDGYIAKRLKCISNIGTILDPLADKLLIASAYIMLTILNNMSFWLLVIVMFRDLVILLGYTILIGIGYAVPIQPSYISKLNTVLQIALMVLILIEQAASWVKIPVVINILIVHVVLTTIVSGIQYIWIGIGILQLVSDQSDPTS